MTDHPPTGPVIVATHHDATMLPLTVRTAQELMSRGTQETGVDRHWLHGPHLRLWTTHGEQDRAREAARAAIEAHPSSTLLEAATYERTSQALGAVELVPGPYLPMRADNWVGNDDNIGDQTVRLIGRDALELKRRVLSCFVPALATSSSLGAIPAALRLLGPMTMLASRWQVGGVRSGYLTFRSHLEDHLNLHDPEGRLRARFEETARNARTARDHVASIVDQVELDDRGLRRGSYRGTDQTLQAWSTAFARAIELAGTGYDAGAITEDLGPGYQDVASADFTGELARWTFDDNRSYSAFHRKLRGLNTLPERANTREFAAYRFVVNQFIRAASLLDVSPIERYFCSLIFSQAVEGYFDTPWTQLLDLAREGQPA